MAYALSVRHNKRRRRIPILASPVTATKHELGLLPSSRVVSCGSAPKRMLLSSPSCTQQGTSRGAVWASRFDPLAFSGDTRGRSKALFFAVRNGTSITNPEPVKLLCDPENWTLGQSVSVTIEKDIISAHISFPARAVIVPLLDWLPACVARDFCNPENFDASGVLVFEECLAHCHPPHWIADWLQDRLR